MARAMVDAAAADRAIQSSMPGESTLAPVAMQKTRSPSIGVWTGQIARAKPSWAAIASRFACALVSTASVAMTAIVVLASAPGA